MSFGLTSFLRPERRNHTVDEFLGEEIQSRAQAEEIESSSRFSETENAIFANTNFLMPGPEDYSMEAVSFTFVGNCLTTLRDVPLRSFTELQRRIVAMPQSYSERLHGLRQHYGPACRS